jgi:hypothetical protein
MVPYPLPSSNPPSSEWRLAVISFKKILIYLSSIYSAILFTHKHYVTSLYFTPTFLISLCVFSVTRFSYLKNLFSWLNNKNPSLLAFNLHNISTPSISYNLVLKRNFKYIKFWNPPKLLFCLSDRCRICVWFYWIEKSLVKHRLPNTQFFMFSISCLCLATDLNKETVTWKYMYSYTILFKEGNFVWGNQNDFTDLI